MAHKDDIHKADALALERIRNILWPDGNADHEWSSAEVEDIANVMRAAGFGPERPPGGGHARKAVE
jgi:hypothetical protein